MAMSPPVQPAEPSLELDEPDTDHFDEERIGVHAWLGTASFELDDPLLAGVPFN